MLPQACELSLEVELECRFSMLNNCLAMRLSPLQLIEMGKKCLQLALELTDLLKIQECAYIIADLSNTVNDKIRLHKRDQASQLYLAV